MKRPKQPLPTLKQDSVDAIPSSNSIDSAMYERDKQIYKCSTMRQGGKWDSKYKPSILNCPLPEIPKEANESPKSEREKESQQTNYSKTLQRPPMKLPTNVKAIPPPKIDSPTSLTKSTSVTNENSNVLPKNHETNAQTESSPQTSQSHVQSPKSSVTTVTSITSNTTTTITNGNQSKTQGPELETAINPNDESNYAVTEL